MSVYYHYTNYNGFKGIINSKSIWLTQVNRPDDPLEATLTKAEFLSILDQFSSTHKCVEEIKDIINDELIKQFNDRVRNSQYAFSLTRLRDNRDHWKKYGDAGRGICIGFDLDKMKPLLKAGDSLNQDIIRIVEVGYDTNVFKDLVKKKLDFIEHHPKKTDLLMIELLHRDIAIGKKSLSYSNYVETRLSFSKRDVDAAKRFIDQIYNMFGIKGPTKMDFELEKYLSTTGIEEELFDDDKKS